MAKKSTPAKPARKAAKPPKTAKTKAKAVAKPAKKPARPAKSTASKSKPAKNKSLKSAAKPGAKKKSAPNKPKAVKPLKKSPPKSNKIPAKPAKPAPKAAKAKPAPPAKKSAPAKKTVAAAKPAPARKPAVAAKPAVAQKKAAAPAKAVKAAPKPVKSAPPKAVEKPAASTRPAPKPTKAELKKKADEHQAALMASRHNLIPDIAQPTGMYNGVLVCEHPKPFPSKTPYSETELAKLREALIEERARLIAELASLTGVGREALDLAREHPGYSVHMAEHATDLQTAEANMGVRTIEEERLELVEAAIERIDKNVNHYGLCLACGNKIGIQRLIARPHAHLCMDCRTRYEKIRSRRGY